MQRRCIWFLVILVVSAGCSGKGSPAAARKATGRTLLIGLIPEQNIFRQMERYEPIAEYVHSRTGIAIRLRVLPRYGNIVASFKSLGLDGAVFGSFTYALAHERIGVVVLARPETDQGVSTYHGLIFVRKDSGIRTARQMRGKRFAFVDRATTAGYLLPLKYFRENGVDDYRTYFAETYFAGTHEDVVHDVLKGKADVGAAKNTVYERLAAADGRIARDLVILARSPDVPENGLAVRGDIEEPVRKALKDALIGMHDDPEGREILRKFGAHRFVATDDADYRAVRDYAWEVHLDLSRYDYDNN